MEKSTIKWLLIIAAIILVPNIIIGIRKQHAAKERINEGVISSPFLNNASSSSTYQGEESQEDNWQTKYEERLQQLYHKGYVDGYKHGDLSEDWEWGDRANESDCYDYWTFICEDSELEDETLYQEYRRGFFIGIEKRKESGH